MLTNIILKLFTIFILFNYFYPLTHANIRQKRIVGGDPISIEKVPYIVSIQNWLFRVHQCAGSIIGDVWILTTAHCHITVNVNSKHSSKYFALVGSNSDATKGHFFNIILTIKHPKFSSITMDYDIELLKLNRPITEQSGGKIIQLPSINERVYSGDVVRISGWGLDENRDFDDLRSVELDIINRNICKDIYKEKVIITGNMICASRPGKDACHSDSGGPMVIRKYGDNPDDDHDVLVGIVSWGAECGSTKYPGVYTKVSAFLKWISETQKLHH